jgi:nicotinate phosphoribosyltransferase
VPPKPPLLPASPDPSPLLADLYQFAMMQAYLAAGRTATACFEFFVRSLPPGRGFLVAAGLAQAVEWLQGLRFRAEELDWLRASGLVSEQLLEYLAHLRFTGDVDAMPEGRVFFPGEPILRVVAPLPIAQFVETRLINLLHLQTVVATKAAHLRLRAPGRTLIDFGLRRAHGAEAGLFAARAAWIAGFDGTATLRAAAAWGIPAQGTMAHAFVQAFERESDAFDAFATARPRDLALVIDTYDCARAARRILALMPGLAARGIALGAVRIDSGDLAAEAARVRRILDEGGLAHVRILASGGIDEALLEAHARAQPPIDGYGVGTSLSTSSDAPALDCAYKLQDYAGIARRKLSAGKATWPGRKQVWRHYAPDGSIAQDTLSIDADAQRGERLLTPVMRQGRVVDDDVFDLDAARSLCRADLARLPATARPAPRTGFAPTIAPALRALAAATDARIATEAEA